MAKISSRAGIQTSRLPDPLATAANTHASLAGASTSLLHGRENKEDKTGRQMESPKL